MPFASYGVDGTADARGLRERRVEHPLLAELVEEPGGDPEHPAPGADVLAEHHDAVVGLHLLLQRVVDGLDDVLLRHRPASSPSRVGVTSVAAFSRRSRSSSAAEPPPAAPESAYTCSVAVSGAGSAAFHARLTSVRSRSIPSSSISPRSCRCLPNRMIGSFVLASSTSSRDRYVRSSSSEVCGWNR